MSQKKTHFGFQTVSPEEKTTKVREVFSSVAQKYDIMNDVMSFGLHRFWKKAAIELTAPRLGHIVLDLAAGTGDLSKQFAKHVGPDGLVVMTDINREMLQEGRDNLINAGIFNNITYQQVNAEHIPFADNTFDRISIGFGLRNVTDKEKALSEMHRVLKPNGRAMILEFSKPKSSVLSSIYDQYSFKFLPLMGKLIAKDRDSYQYLAESIRMHPDQETLKTMMETVGFTQCEYHNLTNGIVAIHIGHKKP